MFSFNSFHLLVALVVLVCMTGHVTAFGAGNIGSISKIEGQNWRHGDIEDALLVLSMAKALNGKKFNKLQISRVYFGNWLRDYSQAVDVGTVKNVSAEAIRLLLSILGFLTFGYGSGEFEVTADRLGCYRPEEHIDNPKDYADNVDARQYDRRLRGPVDEEIELAVDPRTGLKNYIANDTVGITTAIDHCRDLFKRCIQHGRAYRDGRNKADKYEALRLLGTGLHCLEDYFAHSNYIELALIEMGEDRIFPHVGRNTKLRIDDIDEEVYPIVTGTFGGVDFLHSVTGEVSDKLAQNELEELEGTLTDSKNKDTSLLRELLDKIPDGVFGGKHKSDEIDEIQANATAAQMQGTTVSPREPEEFARYIGQVFESIMPAIEFHDSILKGISTAIENIPILPKIIEQLEEQLSVWVFSIIAPTIVPIVQQLRSEMKTGSEEIISSSEQAQHIVFDDDDSSNPTHSMLSKDHFSNLLNEPAGRAASAMVKWVVPQLMDIMDSDDDPAEVIDYCILGVMAHPVQRNLGRSKVKEGRKLIYNVIKDWWNDLGDAQDQYRQFLSRNGVKEGRNHKTGVVDTGHGHGCSGNLHMYKQFANAAPTTMEDRIAGAAADAILEGATGAISGFVSQNTGGAVNLNTYKRQEEQESSSGGGFLSGLIGGIIGKASSRDDDEDKSNRYGSNNQSSYGGHRNDDDDDSHYGQTQSNYSRQESNYSHRNDDDNNRYESSYSRRNDDDNNYGRQESSYSRRTEESSYGSGGASADYYGSSHREEESSYSRQESSYDRQETSYGREERQESYGRQESSYGSGYGHEEREESYGDGYGGGYGNRDDGPGGYGGRGNGSGGYGGSGGFGGPGSFGGPGDPSGYEDESSYGGGRHHRRDDDDDRRGW